MSVRLGRHRRIVKYLSYPVLLTFIALLRPQLAVAEETATFIPIAGLTNAQTLHFSEYGEPNLVITEANVNLVTRFRVSADGVPSREPVAGIGKQGDDLGKDFETELFCPTDTAEAPDGTVFIADRLNNRIVRVAPDRTSTLFAGTGEAGFGSTPEYRTNVALNWPTSVALRNNTLFVADSGNDRVLMIPIDTGIATVFVGKDTPDETSDAVTKDSDESDSDSAVVQEDSDESDSAMAEDDSDEINSVGPEERPDAFSDAVPQDSPYELNPTAPNASATSAPQTFLAPSAVRVAGPYVLVASAGSHRIDAILLGERAITPLVHNVSPVDLSATASRGLLFTADGGALWHMVNGDFKHDEVVDTHAIRGGVRAVEAVDDLGVFVSGHTDGVYLVAERDGELDPRPVIDAMKAADIPRAKALVHALALIAQSGEDRSRAAAFRRFRARLALMALRNDSDTLPVVLAEFPPTESKNDPATPNDPEAATTTGPPALALEYLEQLRVSDTPEIALQNFLESVAAKAAAQSSTLLPGEKPKADPTHLPEPAATPAAAAPPAAAAAAAAAAKEASPGSAEGEDSTALIVDGAPAKT